MSKFINGILCFVGLHKKRQDCVIHKEDENFKEVMIVIRYSCRRCKGEFTKNYKQ